MNEGRRPLRDAGRGVRLGDVGQIAGLLDLVELLEWLELVGAVAFFRVWPACPTVATSGVC